MFRENSMSNSMLEGYISYAHLNCVILYLNEVRVSCCVIFLNTFHIITLKIVEIQYFDIKREMGEHSYQDSDLICAFIINFIYFLFQSENK